MGSDLCRTSAKTSSKLYKEVRHGILKQKRKKGNCLPNRVHIVRPVAWHTEGQGQVQKREKGIVYQTESIQSDLQAVNETLLFVFSWLQKIPVNCQSTYEYVLRLLSQVQKGQIGRLYSVLYSYIWRTLLLGPGENIRVRKN